MDEGGDVGQGVRMVLAATVSALVVAALTIVVGRALLITAEGGSSVRSAPLILVSR